jgi:hypothetical protein
MITESNFIDSDLSASFNASAVNILYNNEFNRNIIIENTPLLMIINENDDDNHHHDIDDDLDEHYQFQIDDEEDELELEQTQETFDCQ